MTVPARAAGGSQATGIIGSAGGLPSPNWECPPSESLFSVVTTAPLTALPRLASLSVIVADDVVEIQLLLERWLSEAGCSVKCAATGNEVAQLVRREHVDLVITDVIMPDGDGLDVILNLKAARSDARVLAISGGGRHLQATDCLKFAKGLGAHEVLLKPFDREQFLAAVNRVAQGGA